MAIVEEMLSKKSGHKDQLDSQHRQKRLLDEYMTSSKLLSELYSRQDQTKRPSRDYKEACSNFYIQLNKLTDLEPDILNTNDQIDVTGPAEADLTTDNDKPSEKLVEFTDEEGYGRYFDLNECHEAFLQVVKDQESKPNYLTYLQTFCQFDLLPRDKKLTAAYRDYVQKLLEYFRDYSRRARPLFDHDAMEKSAAASFEEQWLNKKFGNWFKNLDTDDSRLASQPMVDLESYRSIDQLKELGLDCLKQELQARGLKCGGTLEERALRLWSVRGKSPDEIDDSIKASVGTKGKKKKNVIDPYHIASIEAKLMSYADFYADHRQATIENVQRKQARTADERNESDEESSDADDEDNDDLNDVIYNPKNLPLGWDGKPIPYWLYKLHGLNLTYTCEICGNTTYKGPKAFQRHFADQRHAHGMKCLGIPNTAHFANITKIEDAITLWEKLKKEKQREQFQPQVEEEYEDSQGNVVNKKTYEDLKRQGLL